MITVATVAGGFVLEPSPLNLIRKPIDISAIAPSTTTCNMLVFLSLRFIRERVASVGLFATVTKGRLCGVETIDDVRGPL